MRKLVALVMLSTLAAVGAVATNAGTASALEPNSRIEQATVERQDMQFVSREGADDLFMNTSTYEQPTEPQALAVSAHEMLAMAMPMNLFNQLSDMASSVISSANAANSHMSRGIKS